MAMTAGTLTLDILIRFAGGAPVAIGTVELPINSSPEGLSIDATTLRDIFRTDGE